MKRATSNKAKWIEAGYQNFGQLGPESLNVERLSMMVGLNRSSFYHYFGEVELFEKGLLNHHIECSKILGQTISECENFDPDLIQVIWEYRREMAFHRQLLIHEAVARYKKCFNLAKSHTESKVFQLWSAHNQDRPTSQEFSLFRTVRDFYLLHFDQTDEKEVRSILEDIQLLLQGVPS